MSLVNPEDYVPLTSNSPTPPMLVETNGEVDKIYSPAPRFMFTPPADPQPNPTIHNQPSFYYSTHSLHQSHANNINIPQATSIITNNPTVAKLQNGRSSSQAMNPIVFYPSAPSTSQGRQAQQQIEVLTHPVWQIPKLRRSPNEMVRRSYQPTQPSSTTLKNSIHKAKLKSKYTSNLPSARTILLEDILASQLRGMTVNNWMFRIEQLLRFDRPSAWKQCP